MKLEVIGLSGKAGSGKDFLATQVLIPFYGYKQYALAWPLKALAYARLGDMPYNDVYKIKPPAVRKMLQQLGTEGGRDVYGDDYWTNQAYAWMRTLAETGYGNKFVITDVRFPNEAEFVRSLGGKVIRLEFGPGRHSVLSGEAAQHVSETALDNYSKFDAKLLNGSFTTANDMEQALKEAGIL